MAGLGLPLLSRMEVFAIEAPDRLASMNLATALAGDVLRRHRLQGRIAFDRRALCLLAHLSPRRMKRAAEQAVAAAVVDERIRISEDDLWREVGGAETRPLH